MTYTWAEMTKKRTSLWHDVNQATEHYNANAYMKTLMCCDVSLQKCLHFPILFFI